MAVPKRSCRVVSGPAPAARGAVAAEACRELARQRGDIAGHEDVELSRRSPEQQVTRRSPDELHISPLTRELKQLATTGQLAQRSEDGRAVEFEPGVHAASCELAGDDRPHPVRTAIPSPAR